MVMRKSFQHYQRLVETFRGREALNINFNVIPGPLERQFPLIDDDIGIKYSWNRQRFYESLVQALSHSRVLNATDPRDRVYALIRLVKDYKEGDIDINYGLSVAQAYCSVVELALRKPNPLNFLINATSCNRNPAYGFPTWLPDWSFTLKDPAVRSLDTSIEQAATTIVADPPAILECRSILSVCGFHLGSILRISIEKGVDQDASAMNETVREWEDFVNAATEICFTARVFGAKKQETVAERSTNFKALLRTIMLPADDILPGDEIWILHHCSMPMVLRRVNDHYLVVGPARLDSNKLGEPAQEWVDVAEKRGHSENHKIERIFLH
ncbi:unnamed protein product [Sphagnum balticum]